MRPFSGVENSIIDRLPREAARDPALVCADGLFHCYHTTAVRDGDRYQLYLDESVSRDLRRWEPVQRLTTSKLNFSSPGNALRVGNEWVLCVQSYPVDPGTRIGNDDSRLWLMRSRDLREWSAPEPMHPQGCRAEWAQSRRQIDPYLVEHDGRYWCFYKNSGCLGLLVSDDLTAWEEASPERPVLDWRNTPGGHRVENPCVVGRKIGLCSFSRPADAAEE